MSTIVWPACGGAAAALVRSRDWSATSLGPSAAWPQALRITVDMVLRSPVAMVVAWGEDRVLIYNDAYAIGEHLPRAKVLFASGYPGDAGEEDIFRRVPLLQKPYRLDEMARMVQRLLGPKE